MWVIRKARVRLWNTWGGGGDMTGVHFGHAPCLSPWRQQETEQKQENSEIPSSRWLYQRGPVGSPETQTGSSERGDQVHICIILHCAVFYCILLYSTVPHCRRGSWWISVSLSFFSDFPPWWKLRGWCSPQWASEPRGCSHSPAHKTKNWNWTNHRQPTHIRGTVTARG